MQFRFIGDPKNAGDGPRESVHYGCRFVKGVPVEVNEKVAAKLAKNSHFEQVKRGNQDRYTKQGA